MEQPHSVKPKRTLNPKTALFMWVALILFVVIGIKNANKQPSEQSKAPHADYSISYYGSSFQESSKVLNPATLEVAVTVKNTSNVTGSPTCLIKASDASGVYTGSDIFTDKKPLKPGNTWNFNAQLTIKKEGASYITTTSSSCS